MKKIAFRVSENFFHGEILNLIKTKLVYSNIYCEIFKTSDTLNSLNFHGLIMLTNSIDTEKIQNDIMSFHSESKPIITFSESTKYVARTLKKFKPVIAITENETEALALNKLGIDTEICPPDDFITDRYTKIISSPVMLSNQTVDLKTKKGIEGLCKELVEMS